MVWCRMWWIGVQLQTQLSDVALTHGYTRARARTHTYAQAERDQNMIKYHDMDTEVMPLTKG